IIAVHLILLALPTFPSPSSTLFPYTTLFRSLCHSYCKRFTMDTIWNCAFGVDIDLQKKPDNEYFKHCEYIMGQTSNLLFISYLRSEEHTSELQSRENLVCRLLLEKKKT